MKSYTFFYIIIFCSLLFSSCKKDPIVDENKEMTTSEISEWIYDQMKIIYFWEDNIPSDVNPLEIENPKELFESILYREEDKWSYITDDYTAFSNELQGTPLSMGYSPAFGKFSESDKVFIIVEYVYPETPASEAGLKRGDIILSIDGTQIDTANYLNLFRQDSYTASLGYYDGETIILSDTTVSMTSRTITTNPVLHHEIIDPEGINTGYLVYTEFISGNSNIFLRELDNAMSEFKTAGIKDLILDFRYNPGGEINTAGYLASCVAPASTVDNEDILVKFLYNDFLTDYLSEYYGSTANALNFYFPGANINLNLDKIYFLTSNGTASACELVISGLRPYMDVIMVGDSTYGKYTGAWVYPDNIEPARHNWAIIPIVLKYANALGETDFKDGLIPDYLIEDNLLNAVAFGNLQDPMLAKAVELIGGEVPTSQKKSFSPQKYTKLKKPGYDLRTNLIIEHEPIF